MALHLNNDISFAWQQNLGELTSNISEIYYCEYLGGNLSKAENISNTSTPSVKPVIISDLEGTIHAVWGERLLPVRNGALQPATDIFYAFKKSGTWSKPVSIFHNTDLNPNNLYGINYKLKCDKENNLYLMWSFNDSIGFKTYFSLIKDSRCINPIQLFFRSDYYDFLFDNNNIIHVSLIHPFYEGQTDYGSVFYTYSADSGKTWAKEIMVNLSGKLPAYGIRILRDGNSIIHIIWGKDKNGDNFPDCFYHSLSIDGIQWSEPKIIGGNLGGYSYYDPIVEMDSKNHMYLFWTWSQYSFTLPFELYYSFFDGSIWTDPILIKENGSNPEICIDKKDILHLIYFDQVNSVPPDHIVKWFYIHSKDPVTKISKKTKLPIHYSLKQNYPNPFNPATIIEYDIPATAHVTLNVYDINGKIISELVNSLLTPGTYKVPFEKGDHSSGIYFYQLKTGKYVETKKMILLR